MKILRGALLLFILLLWSISSLQAQTVIENWTPEAMVNLPITGSPELSPDGSMIAYTVVVHGPTEPKFIADVSNQIIRWFDMYLGR